MAFYKLIVLTFTFVCETFCSWHGRTLNTFIKNAPLFKRHTRSEMECISVCQVKGYEVMNFKQVKQDDIICHCHHDSALLLSNDVMWTMIEKQKHISKVSNVCKTKTRNATIAGRYLRSLIGQKNIQISYGTNCYLQMNKSESNTTKFHCDRAIGIPIEIIPTGQIYENAYRIKSGDQMLTYWTYINGERQVAKFEHGSKGKMFFLELMSDGTYQISTNCGCYLKVHENTSLKKSASFECNLTREERTSFHIEAQKETDLLNGLTTVQMKYNTDCYFFFGNTNCFICSQIHGTPMGVQCVAQSCTFRSSGKGVYATPADNGDRSIEIKSGDGDSFTLIKIQGMYRIMTSDGCVLTLKQPLNTTASDGLFKCNSALDSSSLFHLEMKYSSFLQEKTWIEKMYLKVSDSCFMKTVESSETGIFDMVSTCSSPKSFFQILDSSITNRYKIKIAGMFLHWDITKQNETITQVRSEDFNDLFIIRPHDSGIGIYTENSCPLVFDVSSNFIRVNCKNSIGDLFQLEVTNLFNAHELVGGKLIEMFWYQDGMETCKAITPTTGYTRNLYFRCDSVTGSLMEIKIAGGAFRFQSGSHTLFWRGDYGNIKNAEFRNRADGDTFGIRFLSNRQYRILFGSNCYLFVKTSSNNAEFRCGTTPTDTNIYTLKVAPDSFFQPLINDGFKLSTSVSGTTYILSAAKYSAITHDVQLVKQSSDTNAEQLHLVAISNSNYFYIKSEFGYMHWKRNPGQEKVIEFRKTSSGDKFLIKPVSSNSIKIIWRTDCALVTDDANLVFKCGLQPGEGDVFSVD